MLRLVVMLLCVTVTPAIADPIVLRDMGSFHIGGRVVEISGRPVQQIVRVPGGPPSRLDPNGRYQVECTFSFSCRRIGRANIICCSGMVAD